MANYSFADRLGRVRSMQAAIDGFSPAFDPADESLTPTAFAPTLDDSETMNEAVDQQLDQYKTGVRRTESDVEESTTAGRPRACID